MAIKTISQFDAATPTPNDKILFEQNGEGRSATLADLPISTKTQNVLDTKVNTASVLTLEEIQETTDLTGKVAGADNIKTLINNRIFGIKVFFAKSESATSVVFNNVPIGFRRSGIFLGNGYGPPVFRYCALFKDGGTTSSEQSISEGTISITNNGDRTANITISPVNQYGYYNLIIFY